MEEKEKNGLKIAGVIIGIGIGLIIGILAMTIRFNSCIFWRMKINKSHYYGEKELFIEIIDENGSVYKGILDLKKKWYVIRAKYEDGKEKM